MELLNEIRFYKKHGKTIRNVLGECALSEGIIPEDDTNSPEKVDVLNKIQNDDYIRNDYESFANELYDNKRAAFLTKYTPQDFEANGVQTFQVKGYPIGFALKPTDDGDVDIISVHNNSDVSGIGSALIDSAKRHGGTTLDHFDGYLTDFYRSKGFDEYDRYKWDDEYAPEDWNYDTYGRPDVIMRRLKTDSDSVKL